MTEESGLVQAHALSAAVHPRLDPATVFDALVNAGVAGLYPDFQGWFYGKVLPGLRKGERCIIPWTIESRLVGVAICKRSSEEGKLCTLWVSPDVRARGVAAKLAREAFTWIGNPKPLFTVPEERSAEFAGLVQGWEFSKPMAYDGLYRTGRVEYVFNGPLRADAH